MLTLTRDTEELARLVAEKVGQAPEEVIRDAIQQRARELGVTMPAARPVDMDKIDAITKRYASLPILDTRSAKEILDEAWGDPQ